MKLSKLAHALSQIIGGSIANGGFGGLGKYIFGRPARTPAQGTPAYEKHLRREAKAKAKREANALIPDTSVYTRQRRRAEDRRWHRENDLPEATLAADRMRGYR